MVGAKGFEPSTSWSRTSSRNTILLARLALFCVEQVRLGWYSAVNGLKSDSTFGKRVMKSSVLLPSPPTIRNGVR